VPKALFLSGLEVHPLRFLGKSGQTRFFYGKRHRLEDLKLAFLPAYRKETWLLAGRSTIKYDLCTRPFDPCSGYIVRIDRKPSCNENEIDGFILEFSKASEI